jgi:hypothetical protein
MLSPIPRIWIFSVLPFFKTATEADLFSDTTTPHKRKKEGVMLGSFLELGVPSNINERRKIMMIGVSKA